MKESDKALYTATSTHKNIVIDFPNLGLSFGNDKIWFETMELQESIMEGDNVKFIGCIPSMFKVTLQGVPAEIKNAYMEVTIRAEESEPIPLFSGYVDSAILQTNKSYKKITAYDVLKSKGNIDIASWYNQLEFPIRMKAFRDSLFAFIGIIQENVELPVDEVFFRKQYKPVTLKALDIIKSICQINGACGIINRSGRFEYRILQELFDAGGTYPSNYLFPGDIYPSAAITNAQNKVSMPQYFSFYKKVDYQEYTVRPVDQLTIRQTENDEGISVGSGENNYVIQGNWFTKGLSDTELETIAEQIYQNVQGIVYHPFVSDNNGLPWIECGKDTVSYYVIQEDGTFSEQNFYVMSRHLKGIQNLRDEYRAEGKENQRETVVDLRTQVAAQGSNSSDSRIAVLEEQIRQLQENQEKWESVAKLPSDPDPHTWYVIRGEALVN